MRPFVRATFQSKVLQDQKSTKSKMCEAALLNNLAKYVCIWGHDILFNGIDEGFQTSHSDHESMHVWQQGNIGCVEQSVRLDQQNLFLSWPPSAPKLHPKPWVQIWGLNSSSYSNSRDNREKGFYDSAIVKRIPFSLANHVQVMGNS